MVDICQYGDLPIDFTSYVFVHKKMISGQPWWPSCLALTSAQGMILETLDGVPRPAPCMEPISPSAYVSASLCVSLMNK